MEVTELMRSELIKSRIRELFRILGRKRPAVDKEALREIYKLEGIVGLTREIKKVLGLECRIKLGVAERGMKENINATIFYSRSLPLFGTTAFKKTEVLMVIRGEYLRTAPFESVARTVAHELCHIVLASICPPMDQDEVSVDLAVIMLGFSEISVTGHSFIATDPVGGSKKMYHRLGYLRGEEIQMAIELIEKA